MKPQAINGEKLGYIHRRDIIRWLKANGIDPNLIPLHRPVIFTGNRLIFREVIQHQKRAGGKTVGMKRHPEHGWQFETRRRVVRVRVPFKATP